MCYLPCRARLRIKVPIRSMLETEGAVFGPEDVPKIVAAFDAARDELCLIGREDPATLMVAKLIIELARQGERDPKTCANCV
jgi:hypothetical protein